MFHNQLCCLVQQFFILSSFLKVMPYNYAKETGDILFGDILPHDDSVNDRRPGSKLTTSQDITQDAWKRELIQTCLQFYFSSYISNYSRQNISISIDADKLFLRVSWINVFHPQCIDPLASKTTLSHDLTNTWEKDLQSQTGIKCKRKC